MEIQTKIRNKKLEDEFWRERKKVLAEWPTGKEVNLDEAIEYHKSLPPNKIWTKRVLEAKQKGETIVQMMGMGHATLEQHIELITYAQNEGHADLLGTNPDNFTRLHDYEGADRGIKESQRLGDTVLNGFPIVNYGVAGTRKVVESVNVPLQMRFSALDPRLIVEIGYAAGFTAMSGDAMLTFIQHNSKTPVETVLYNYQYIHRLQGYYEEKGCPMSEAPYGPIAVVTPPSLRASQALTQALMIAEQGVKHIDLGGFQAQGNVIQDVAGARAYYKLAREYLDRFGYEDVDTNLEVFVLHSRTPDDTAVAFGVLSLGALTARLSGAQIFCPQTISEGKYISRKEALADSYKCAKTGISMLRDQKIELDSKALAIEADMFEQEVRAIMEAVLDLGDGDVVIGVIRAVEAGVIDHPFGTHPSIACKAMGVRDAQGAVRWFDHGNLPFTSDVLEFHREKIAERVKKEGRDIDYDRVVDDIIAVGDGTLLFPHPPL